MARQPIKSISSTPEKFIPKSHASDKTLREDAESIMDRPLVMFIRKMNRDEHFKVRDLLEFKDDMKPEKGIKGTGDVARFIWENNVTEVLNVVVRDSSGAVQMYDSVTGTAKDELWNTEGMDAEINEGIMFARSSSVLNEVEAKN